MDPIQEEPTPTPTPTPTPQFVPPAPTPVVQSATMKDLLAHLETLFKVFGGTLFGEIERFILSIEPAIQQAITLGTIEAFQYLNGQITSHLSRVSLHIREPVLIKAAILSFVAAKAKNAKT